MKVAIVGCGRMGQRFIQGVQELGLSLVGVCDQSEEALQKTASDCHLKKEHLYSDYGQMLKKAGADVVVVATTAPSHALYTCMAAESGVGYVLCEKPIGISLAECDQMIETCRRHGTRLAVNHQMRFMDQYTIPKKLLSQESFGGLTSITVTCGNFGMAMNGTHYFEMFRFMTDENPHEVTAWFSNEKVPNPRGAQFEDKAGSVRLLTSSGKRFYLEAGFDQGHGVQVTYLARFGRIVIDELTGRMTTSVRKAEHRHLPTTRYGMPADEEQHRLTPADAHTPSKHVLEALLKGDNYPTGEDGRQAVATLVAAYESSENNHRAVRLNESLPFERKFPWA